jgi:hypothetical protein
MLPKPHRRFASAVPSSVLFNGAAPLAWASFRQLSNGPAAPADEAAA